MPLFVSVEVMPAPAERVKSNGLLASLWVTVDEILPSLDLLSSDVKSVPVQLLDAILLSHLALHIIFTDITIFFIKLVMLHRKEKIGYVVTRAK